MSAKRGERILGPYEEKNGWRVVEIDALGNRTSTVLATEAKALRYVEILRAELAKEDHTTATALEEYARHLATKGDKAASIAVTRWAIELFFVEPENLRQLTEKRCHQLYASLREPSRGYPRSAARTGPALPGRPGRRPRARGRRARECVKMVDERSPLLEIC